MNESAGGRIWRATLTGIPFAIYKMGFGWYELHHDCAMLGMAALIWGAIDVLVNVLAVLFPKDVAWCLLANIGRWIDRKSRGPYWENILLAIDTTASFVIVAVMIWFGRLPLTPPITAHAWNVAVICNILAVGLQQLYEAIRRPRRGEASS